MDCVLAVVEVSMVYFAVEDEPAPGHSLGHAPGQRADVRSIILICGQDQTFRENYGVLGNIGFHTAIPLM